MGVDVMRWLFARQKPEENILFGYHAADVARRELLVLWNVFAFFVTYARTAGWRPAAAVVLPALAEPEPEIPAAEAPAEAEFAGPGPVLDRWIRSRTARLAATVRADLDDFDTRDGTEAVAAYIDELSTWYLRRSRRRFSRGTDSEARDAAFQTLHLALGSLARILAPTLPFLAEHLHRSLVAAADPDVAESVHLTRWPDEELAAYRDEPLEAAMATLLRAVELARTLRGQAGIRVRQPLAKLWLAVPAGRLTRPGSPDEPALLGLLADELNVKEVAVIGDESELVERRVKPLLPVLGSRGRGTQIPAVMAAARSGEVEYLPGGGVRLAGVELAPDEVEILATPRPGTAVAEDDGVVVVIDTTLSDELRAEGDARELQRAIQDLRKQAELALDDRIEVWLAAEDGLAERLGPHLDSVAAETLADELHLAPAPDGLPSVELATDGGRARVALRRRTPGG
jgi:isoleucyl-tRNA synthetase